MARLLRRNQIDLRSTTVYHVVSRCTRALHLLKDQQPSLSTKSSATVPDSPAGDRLPRKDWILLWLRDLATHFALEIVGFALMDNHVHVLVNLQPGRVEKWSDKQVAERWLAVHRPRNGYMQPIEPTTEHVTAFAADPRKVEMARQRLASLSQFMKDFKQHVAERANREDGVTGSFWESRYQCKPIFDEAQLLATMCYIDLNPFAAGVCRKPAEGEHTSVKVRVHHAAFAAGKAAAERGKAGASLVITPGRGRGRRRWLAPMRQAGRGLLSGLTLSRYLRLLERTARLLRPGKHQLKRSDRRPIDWRGRVSPALLAQRVQLLFEETADLVAFPAVAGLQSD
ncbi:MAG: hypothetical protein IT445_07560 [Phycisphaeraceae bacterium]|nr:hypothetical protein [Phycisphaeraceae bacterium]